jgi:hypothetical protein
MVGPDRPQMTIQYTARAIACWVTKATKPTQTKQYLLLCHCNSDCADAPLWYIDTHIAYLVYDFFPEYLLKSKLWF